MAKEANESTKWLYEQLKGKGYNVGKDVNEFDSLMRTNADSRQWAYDTATKSGLNVGKDIDEFSSLVGGTSPSSPVDDLSPATTDPTAEVEPTVENKKQEEGWKPTPMQKAFMMGSVQSSLNSFKAHTDASMERLKNTSEYYNRGGVFSGNKPVKGDMRYNEDAGKIEQTYLTPTGTATADKFAAERETRAYNDYVDNMTVSGQLRRAGRDLSDLHRKREERVKAIHDKWAEDQKNNKAPLAAVLGAQTYVPSIQSDPEYRALTAAIHQAEKRVQTLQHESDRQDGKDVGFWRGFGEVVGDIKTWDFGYSGLMDAMTMLDATSKPSPNRPAKTDAQKEAEQIMLEQTYEAQQAQSAYGQNDSFWNRAGVMTGEMLPFMLDFAIMGGAKSGSSLVTRNLDAILLRSLHKAAPKAARNKAVQWTTKALGAMPEDLLYRAPLMTNTVQGMKTSADIIDRKLGDVVIRDDGTYDFSNDKTWGSAVWQGEANAIIENYSEMFGTHLEGVLSLKTVGKLADTFGAKRLSGILTKASNSELAGIAGTMQKHLNRLGVSDYFGEVGEEYYGQLWRTMLNLDDAYKQNPDGSRTNLFLDGQFHGDIWGGMALSMGLMGAGKYSISAAAYGSMKHRVNKTDTRASEIFTPEVWNGWRERIDGTTNDKIGEMAEAIVADPTLTDEQRTAAMNYMEASLNLRGFNLASVARQRGGEMSEDEAAANESYMDGYSASTPQEMNDAKKMLDLQRGRLASALSEDLVQDFDNDPIGALSVTHDPELRHIASDYVNAKAVYDGMIQRVRDDVDGRIAQSNAMIDSRINRETGMIQPATMKADDRRVYIVNGTVAMFEDGTGVDTNNSSESIIIRDAETGKVEFADPTQFHSVDEAVDAETEKEAARKQIIDEIAVAAANNIDGVLSFTPGESYSVLDIDGNPEDIAILGQPTDENGIPIDGYVDIQYPDGTIQSVATSDLQQWVDAANTRRVEQFDAERQAERAKYESNSISLQENQSEYGNGSEQNNDERADARQDDGGSVVADTTGIVEGDRDRSDIRVYEEGLATSRDEYSEYSERTRRNSEAERLIGIARQRGQYVDRQKYDGLGERHSKRTGESEVYINKAEGKVYKIKNPAAKSPMKGGVQPEDAIYEHLVHNKYFPETRYQFEGISDDIGDLRIVLSQGYIDAVDNATNEQIEAALAEKGLYPEGNYRYGDNEVSVTDVTGDNALLGADGKVYFIDPIIDFKKPIREIIGDGETDDGVPERTPPSSALSRVPLNENGKPDFGAVDADTAWDAIVEKTSNEAMAQSFADNMVAASEAELKKAEKVKTKPTTDIDEFIAADTERIANIDRAKTALDHWKKVAGTKQRRQAEADAVRSAEMRKRAEDARVKAEQEREEREEAERWEAEKRGLDKRLRDTAESVRHVPEAVEVLKDMNPQSIDEVASWLLSRHKVIWSDTKRGGVRIKYGVASHTGFGEGERRKLFGLFASAEKGGISLDRLSEDLFKEACDVFGVAYDNKSARDALIERIGEARTMGDIRNYIANNRIARATRVAAEFDAYEAEQREEHYQEAYHMGYDEYEAYEEQLLVEMENAFRNFDEQEFYGNIADELVNQQRYGLRSNEEAVGEREVAADGGGVEVLSGTESGEAGGAPGDVVGQEVSGGAGYALRDTSGGLPEGASRGLEGPGGGVVDAGVRISAEDLAKLGERDRREVEDYLSRRWSCDVGVIGDVRDIESLPEDSRADIIDAYEDGETWAIYSRGDKKIYIFAGKNGDESLSGVLLHENVHAVVDMLGDDCREFLESYAGQISALPYTNGVFGGMYADIQDLYAEDKAEEEFLAYSLQYVELYNKVLTKIKKSLDEPTLCYLEDKILSKLYEPAGRTDKGEAVHDNSRVQWSRVQEDNGSREREPHEISGGASGGIRESGWESEAGGQPVGERYESTEEYPGRVAEGKAVQDNSRAQHARVQETVVDTEGGLQGGERRERRELGEGGERRERGDEGIAEEAEIASEEDALNSRIEVKDDDWTEGGGYTPTLKRTIVIDGIHNVTQVDAPNDKGDYTGSIFEYEGKTFGDLREVISYIDSSQPATIGERIAEAEAEVNTTPTDGQKKAGNYKKGHVQVGTFDVTIENPKGSKRSGTDADGKKWETTMAHTYGYIRGTQGVDGDHIDVYISSDIDGWNGRKVFVVDQYNPDGSFDEHKVMLGFNDKGEAFEAYLSNYEAGWEKGRRLDVTAANLDDFEKWIESSKRKTKAFADYKNISKAVSASSQGSVADYKSIKSKEDNNIVGRSLSEQEASDLIARMEMSAEEDPKITLSPESWQNTFGLHNSIATPLGEVKMGEGQYQKFVDKKRSAEFGMAVMTLQDPDLILIEPSEAKDGHDSARPFSYVFVKTFIRDGQKIKYYTSVSVLIDGMEVSVSSHFANKTAIQKKLQEMERAYTKKSLLPNSSEWHLAEHPTDVPDLLPTQEKSETSDDKGNTWSSDKQGGDAKSDEIAADLTDFARRFGEGKGVKAIERELSKWLSERTAEDLVNLDIHMLHSIINAAGLDKGKAWAFRMTIDKAIPKDLLSEVWNLRNRKNGQSESGKRVFSIDGNSEVKQDAYDVAKSLVAAAGIDVVEVGDAEARQMLEGRGEGREEFTNLISNRKPQTSEYRQAQKGNTQSSARTTEAEVSDAKLPHNSQTDKSERGPLTLRTSDGSVYGWTEGGKVYLNRDAMNPETPIHEYTHLWDEMVRRENPRLWERGKELMKQTPLWEEVADDPNYADIGNDENAIASEVHSRLTGKRGAERIEKMMSDAAAEPDMVEKAKKFSILHQLKRWLQDMFKGLKKTLSKWTKRDLRNLTTEDFADLTLRDLADGLNPKHGDKNLVAVHNLSVDKLKEAMELGGFPMPSIAITKTGVGHSSFGEISLVFGKDSIDPAHRRNKVYSGDAWTPTFPSMGYKLNSERTSDIYKRANKAQDMGLPMFRAVDFHPDNYERRIDGRGDGSLVEAFKDDYGAKQLFLYERGNPVEKYEKNEVEKYSPEKISLFEKVLNVIGEDRLRNDDYETLEPEIKRIVSAHQGKDLDLMKPLVARSLVSGTIRKALDYADNGNTRTETDIAATQAKIDDRVDPKEYQAWLEEMFAGVVEKKGIRNNRDMFTPSGESRNWESLYDAVTLYNVVKAMQKQAQKGGEGFFGGSIFGASTKEIKDIEKLRMEAEERIKAAPQEEYDAEKKRIEARLEKVSVPSASSSFSDMMDFVDNVKEAVVKSHTADGIYRHLRKLYPDMTIGVAEEIADIVKDIQKMSTRYLEAKPQRAVGFEEVRLAVVPAETPREIIAGLKSHGVPVRIYERGNEQQRSTIISQETSDRDLRFHAAMSRGREAFDELRDRAMAERGIVMPGLNEKEVRVVEVPRHDFEGTGKQALQVAEKWAKENIVGIHTVTDSRGDGFEYSISKDAVEKYVSRSATAKSDNIGVHLAALKKLPEIISESIEAEVHPDYKKQDAKRTAQNEVNEEALIHRFYGAINIEGKAFRVKTTMREYLDKKRLPLAHSYEITQIELLAAPSDGVVSDSGEPLAMTPNSSIPAAKLLKGVEKSYEPGVKLLDASGKKSGISNDILSRYKLEEKGAKYAEMDADVEVATDITLSEEDSEETEDEELLRDGYGAYSDAEVSMENDPWSKAWGESIRTKRQQRQFAERERERMRDRAKSLSSVLGIDIEVIEDASSLKGKKQRAKGWYDTKTGKITVVVGNHNSAADMEATILHEAVAHHGLRQLLGEHFDEFLDKVYEAAENGIKEQIDLLASRNGWNRRVATEEYLAGLAEETEFDRAEERVGGWFDKIKRFFIDMLFKAGFKHIKPGSIGDNELRYILWRSYQNLANPGRYRAFEWEAEDVAMQHKLQVGQYDTTSEKVESAADSGIRFRDGDFTPRDRKLAADVYEKMLSRGSWQFREATQDSMLGLKTLYESILGSNTRIENVAGYENAYLYENRMSSANNGEQHQYFSRFMKPLLDSIHKLCGSKELDRRILTDYMMAKHGLERNEYMRNEAAANGEDTERDFAGLCGLTGEDDWQVAETVARQMVDDYESDHDTAELWDNVKKATNATLEKIYLSGLISNETYNKVIGMYDFYIPLRGWDETTSDEVYGYLTSKDGPLIGNVFKKAGGRNSKADDPIATIAMMADDAIRQGNRNIMKQRFLNFVHGNPSDLVSVNEMWLQHNDVTDEWEPVFADLQPDMTHAEVESEIAKFEAKMEALRTAEPDKYKKGGDARNIPYKVVRGNLNEHQVLVKRNGRTYVITINGNPRAAQALNGLTNPNVEVGGVIGDLLKLGEYVNRHLSAFYTTRNPDFVVSNFMRDMLYSNCMTWVKENPRYALRFHKNFGKVNPLTLRRLLSKWENDNLSDSNYLEKMFKEFMLNGGETGYTSVKDIEGHKRTIASELKKQGSTRRKAWNALGMQLDLLNRSAENCARFAAFLTSREMGRTLDRSIYDAKEVSVNFNKKGSGGKFVNATGQKFLGKLGSYLGGGGRIAFVFWNAGIQGMTNFGRAGKRNPGKAIGGTTALFTLGYVIPLLAQMLGGGDGDDDDKNAYYNLPEYVRRSNICFKAGEQWITIPLPIEYRAIYGMGELACGVISGNERYSNSELTRQMASQISQVMPLDMLEGGGGISPFIPSAFKPMTEAYILNKGWTGLPVYKDTPYNKNDPEWTKAYQSADQHLVAFTRWLNETSGGNDYKKGTIDINPAKLEYLLSGTFGGAVSTTGKLKKMGETALGTREFEWRNMLLANRVIKSGDERTANRKLQNEYYKYLTEYEETNRLRKKYENAADDGILGYAERVDFLYNSPEYLRFEIFEKYKPDIDAIREEIKEETNPEAKKELQEELFSTMRELVDELHDVGK